MPHLSRGTHPYPVTDRGYAWVVLASCFVLRMLVDGFWSSFGILFVQWETYFNISAAETAWMGSAFMLILFLTAPVSSSLAHRVSYRAIAICAGIVTFVCCLAMSLVTNFWYFYMITPFIGFGLGLTYQISFTFFIFYFEKYFTLASMLNSAATGMGFLALPPVMEILIKYYGWRGALQITSGILANICVCGTLLRPPKLIKSKRTDFTRLQSRDDHTPKENQFGFFRAVAKHFDLSLFYNVRFIFQAIVNGLLFGGGICTATIYFVPYAVEVGISGLKASFLMLTVGICCVVVRGSPMGWFVDKKIISASTLGGIALVICGIDIIMMTFTKTFAGLIVVAMAYGLFLGIGGPLVIVVVTYSAGSKEKAPGAVAWTLLQCGVGTLTCMMLTGVLNDLTWSYQTPLIVNGVCVVCAGLILLVDPCLIRLQTRLEQRRHSHSLVPHAFGRDYGTSITQV